MITKNRTTRERTPHSPNGDKTTQIVEKAVELFNRVGYERVKVSDITDALQIGKGTLYLYFKNKKELLLECFRQQGLVISSIENSKEVRGAEGFFERLGPRFVGAHQHFIKLAGTLNLIKLSSESSDPEIRKCANEAYGTMIEPLQTDLEAAIRNGAARPINTGMAVAGLIGFAENVVWTFEDRCTTEEIDDFIIDFIEKALRSPAQQSTTDRHAFSASITDRNGLCTDVDEVRFEGGVKLRGILGQAEIEVDPVRVASITIREANEVWYADIVTRVGAAASVQVQPNLIVSSQTALGTLRIALSDISTIVFSNPQQ